MPHAHPRTGISTSAQSWTYIGGAAHCQIVEGVYIYQPVRRQHHNLHELSEIQAPEQQIATHMACLSTRTRHQQRPSQVQFREQRVYQ